jgi:hypothetical protein
MSTGLGPTDFVAIFSQIFGEMQAVRTGRGLPPLNSYHIGAEWIYSEEDAPRIVVVPTGFSYEKYRGIGNQTGAAGDFNPKPFYRRVANFDAYCWGDDMSLTSTEADTWVSFNTATEIEREYIVAVLHNVGGPAAVYNLSAKWDQPTDMNRRGRLLVVSLGLETCVTQEPYIVLPYSTAGGSGVQIQATIETLWPDGTSTIIGTVIAPP